MGRGMRHAGEPFAQQRNAGLESLGRSPALPWGPARLRDAWA